MICLNSAGDLTCSEVACFWFVCATGRSSQCAGGVPVAVCLRAATVWSPGTWSRAPRAGRLVARRDGPRPDVEVTQALTWDTTTAVARAPVARRTARPACVGPDVARAATALAGCRCVGCRCLPWRSDASRVAAGRAAPVGGARPVGRTHAVRRAFETTERAGRGRGASPRRCDGRGRAPARTERPSSSASPARVVGRVVVPGWRARDATSCGARRWRDSLAL